MKLQPSEHDIRGYFMAWEPPKDDVRYVIGADPAEGIVGWNRHARVKDDKKNDNCALEVVRLGFKGKPDVQVAEFAAPISCQDFAGVIDYVGRLYCGIEPMAHAVVEAAGGGLLTIRYLLDTYLYDNMFQWQAIDGMSPRMTNSVGWYPTNRSVPVLWAKGARYISSGQLQVNSPYLLDELRTCIYDPIRKRGEAVSGKHDDRVRAIMLAGWAARGWSSADEEYEIGEPVEEGSVKFGPYRSYAEIAPTIGDDWMDPNDEWSSRFNERY